MSINNYLLLILENCSIDIKRRNWRDISESNQIKCIRNFGINERIKAGKTWYERLFFQLINQTNDLKFHNVSELFGSPKLINPSLSDSQRPTFQYLLSIQNIFTDIIYFFVMHRQKFNSLQRRSVQYKIEFIECYMLTKWYTHDIFKLRFQYRIFSCATTFMLVEPNL